MFNLIKISKFFEIILISVYIFFLLFKTLNTEITVDEAYSFLNYAYTNDVLNIGIANNHIINSYLISLSTNLGYSEFLIRLPNLLCGILYIFFVYKFIRNKNYKILGYVLLLTNPYLFDFFTIGRGYGISAFLIFLSSYIYLNSKGNELLKPIIFLSLASFSYHTTIVFLICFWIFNLKKMFLKENKIKFFLINIYTFLIVLVNEVILFNITSEGKPLYGIYELTFIDLVIGSFGFASLYLSENFIFTMFLNSLFIIPFFKFKKLTIQQKSLFSISYLTILLIYIIPFIAGRPFPLLRSIFPFFIPIILIIFESISLMLIDLKKTPQMIISSIIILLLSINLILQIDLYETIDWKDEFSQKYILEKEVNSCDYLIPYNELGPVGQYYRFLAEIENFKC